MATAAAIEDAITCCICFNVYRDPHALPCLHTLCKPCIDQLAVRGRVECPECRETSGVKKIRKDFKTQSLIDSHNGKGWESDGASGVVEVCGMCREPGKGMTSHCKECEHFMCTGCEKTHKVIRVCRGHTVRAVKDIVQIAQSKLEDSVNQWKREKNNIAAKAIKFETTIKSVQDESVEQIELTNKHFDKLIRDLEENCSTLVNEIRQVNNVTVETYKKNKVFFDQICREIQSKIDVLKMVINAKHVSTMNNTVDDMDESLKEQVIQIRKRVESLDVQCVASVKVCIDQNAPSIDTRIKLESYLKPVMGSDERSLTLNSNYIKLKTMNYLQLSVRRDCKAHIYSICIIDNNIWCAAWDKGIQIYDKNMQFIKKIVHENYSQVTGLAEWSGDILVTCLGYGLHQITQAGNYVQGIISGHFSDVSTNGKYVYGLRCLDGVIVICTYENNKWLQKGQISLNSENGSLFDKLFVNANSLFISLFQEHCIKKYSLEGELQQIFGSGGKLTLGLNWPILSGVDVHDNLLVINSDNKHLKVYCTEEQTWHDVPVNFDFEPSYAVMDENNIWVVNSGRPSQILKFTKKCCKYTLLYKIMTFIIVLFFLLVAVNLEIEPCHGLS